MPPARPPRTMHPAGPGVRFDVLLLRLLLTGAAAGGIVLEHGFYIPPVPLPIADSLRLLLVVIYWLDLFRRSRRGRPPIPDQRVDWLDYTFVAVIALGVLLYALTGWGGWARGERAAWLLAEAGMVALFLAELWRLNIALSRTLANPGVLLPASFLFLIAVGTLLLKTPVAVPPGDHISWLDAAFTMTSAVCITGLTVRDTATTFTPYGQSIIVIFIQLGGLGFIIFGSMLAMLLGRSLTLRGRHTLSDMLHNTPVHRLTSLVRFMLFTTIGIELVGAILLYPLWEAPPGEELTFTRRLGLSLFHSVSAFCNAGFDTTGNSLIGYRYSPLSHMVIAPLIVLGSLGFPVLHNLTTAARARLRRSRLPRAPMDPAIERLTLHTKIVLVTTAAIYLYGVAFIGAGQIGHIADSPETPGSPWVYREHEPTSLAAVLADASFMSITARTAGFTTVPMDELQPAGRFTLVTLMFVGGAPGGTAGGIKATTLALLILAVVSTIRQRRETEAFGRSISDALIRRAATIAICSILLLVFVTLLLSLTERAPFQVVFFEAVSAASTTGLSLGLTPELTPIGRIIIIATMFLGRIGPLALFGTLVFRRVHQPPYAYAHEPVALG